MKHTLRILLLSLSGILLGLSIYNWNARSILGNQLPMPLGFGMSVVLSGSMEPALSTNDLAIIKESDGAEVGDVIVYSAGGSLVIHRVKEVGQTHLITQGDANNAPDAPVPLEAVKGELAFAIPGVGGIVKLLRQPVMVFAIIGCAVVLTELSYKKEKKKDTTELDALQKEIDELIKELKQT